MPTTLFHVDFDTDAKLANFWGTPAGGQNFLTPLRRVIEGGVSCAEINIGTEVPAVCFITDVDPTKPEYKTGWTKMQEAASAWPNGSIAYCFDDDSTRHGRYVKGSGGWGARTGSVSPAWWLDENHRRVMQIKLLLQSWSQAGDRYSNGRRGLPDIRDLHGLIWRYRMRVQNGRLPPYQKIAPHFQTVVPRIPSVPTSYPGVGGVADCFANAMNTRCFSDDLGFGVGGLFARNVREYVRDSGWVDIDMVPLAKDSNWIAMGGGGNKAGIAPYDQGITYVVASAREWVRNWTGNSYLCLADFNPVPGTEMSAPTESFTGRVLCQSISVIQP